MLLCALHTNVPEVFPLRPLEPSVQDQQSNGICGGSPSDIALPAKSALRRELLARRRALPWFVRRQAALTLVKQFLHTNWLLRYHRIGLFVSSGSEIDTLPLINALLAVGKQVFLPQIPRERHLRQLWFARLHAQAGWTQNRHGIPELTRTHAVRARDLDLLLMPLAGFDRAGNRLGMGGGYYDASLAYLHTRQVWRTPRTVGLAFACQESMSFLPVDVWDVPLVAILTERGVRYFHAR